MKSLTLGERFRRWRATKGYGVHSPLAYRLVKHVVRPPRDVVYYGEETLSATGASQGAAPREVARARMLLRLVAEMQPAYVWTSPGVPDLYLEAIRLAGGAIRLYQGDLFPDDFDKADMVVLGKPAPAKARLQKVMAPGKTLVGFDLPEKTAGQIASLMSGGVLLDGVGSLIAVNTSDPATHRYSLSPM